MLSKASRRKIGTQGPVRSDWLGFLMVVATQMFGFVGLHSRKKWLLIHERQSSMLASHAWSIPIKWDKVVSDIFGNFHPRKLGKMNQF